MIPRLKRKWMGGHGCWGRMVAENGRWMMRKCVFGQRKGKIIEKVRKNKHFGWEEDGSLGCNYSPATGSIIRGHFGLSVKMGQNSSKCKTKVGWWMNELSGFYAKGKNEVANEKRKRLTRSRPEGIWHGCCPLLPLNLFWSPRRLLPLRLLHRLGPAGPPARHGHRSARRAHQLAQCLPVCLPLQWTIILRMVLLSCPFDFLRLLIFLLQIGHLPLLLRSGFWPCNYCFLPPVRLFRIILLRHHHLRLTPFIHLFRQEFPHRIHTLAGQSRTST